MRYDSAWLANLRASLVESKGEVHLEVVVARDGQPSSIRVIRGLGAGLDQQAVQAVRQWRFSPARRNGVPVDVVVDVSVDFTLR